MDSSGDLLADRRYARAEAALDEADWEEAADLARQTIERAPVFAPAWFLLGTAAEALAGGAGRAEAVAAYRRALALDPADRQGAALRLALLGEGAPDVPMPAAYVGRLFDDYAERFDRHLRKSLAYRGPEIVADAVRRAASLRLRPFRFARALDLGCGTGLAGEAFRAACGSLAGVDLSPAMIRKAEAKRCYDELATGDLLAWLAAQADGSADLVLAVDVLVYVRDLGPVLAQAAKALRPDGLLCFTVQAHRGEGVSLGPDHRFAHAEAILRAWAAAAGLVPILVEPASTRQDAGIDVPGLVLVLGRPERRPTGDR